MNYDLHEGDAPLLVSIPHLGTLLPEEIRDHFSAEAHVMRDTDWHLDQLYGFARALGASVLGARISRYAIDLNRPPDGQSLYPGQMTTALCPLQTFRGEALYRRDLEPDETEIVRRRALYWAPYHSALKDELARLHRLHGRVLLWEAHSIASRLPRLFEGKLPDLNFGTNGGVACDIDLLEAVLAPVRQQATPAVFSHVVDGRFRGGYITRQYGKPERGIHAIQLEMCQSLYMDEGAPFDFDPERAKHIQPLLARMLEGGLHSLGA